MNLHTPGGDICARCGQPLGAYWHQGQMRWYSRWTGSQRCPVDAAAIQNRQD